MSVDWPTLDEETIRRRLAQFATAPPDDPYPRALFRGHQARRAAVLIPLSRQEGGWHVLFIHRAANPHDPHSGQVSFPGGRCEDGEATPEEAALRETEEELGVPPRAVRLLGRMPLQRTISNYWVRPVVGVLSWPLTLHLSRDEVERTFWVPLAWLADPAHYEVRWRSLPPPLLPLPVVYYQPYQGELIWGATARMVVRLVRILRGQGEKPVFAPGQ